MNQRINWLLHKTRWIIGLVSLYFCLATLATGQPPSRNAAGLPFQMTDVSSASGIDFMHDNGRSGVFYLPETVSAGLALFDYDNDGLIDVYLLNGAPMPGSPQRAAPTNHLYRNTGNWRFEDVTEASGAGIAGHCLAAAVADIDNDGDQDMYISNYGPKVMLINNGDGTFSKVDSPLLADGNRLGAGAAFLDVDRDGNLDLFVSNYSRFNFDKKVNRTILGRPAGPGPLDYPADTCALFRNNGDGTFVDITAVSNIGKPMGRGMGVVAFDYDDDGDTDIYVCNDMEANFLFVNDGKGKFRENAYAAGVAVGFDNKKQASMGVDCGDFNNDGYLDLISTNTESETPALYRNDKGQFSDQCIAAGLGKMRGLVRWGVVLSDFDNDSFLDLYMACGHLIDTVGLIDDTKQFASRNNLLRGTPQHTFLDVAAQSGDGLSVKKVSRGTGADDLDNDGDLDLVILEANDTPTILRNDSERHGHWCQFQLIGSSTNRDGVGSQIIVHFGNQRRIAEVHSGRGYQSHYGSRVHFGLGNASKIDKVEVRWLGGSVETYEGLELDRLHVLRQKAN